MNSDFIHQTIFGAVESIKSFNGDVKTLNHLSDMSRAVRDLAMSAVVREGITFQLPVNWDFLRFEPCPEDSRSSVLKFPAALEICMYEDFPLQSHFKHDCDHCEFLAHAGGHDLYYCEGVNPLDNTVVARYSDVPERYKSAPVSIAANYPLATSISLAVRLVNER